MIVKKKKRLLLMMTPSFDYYLAIQKEAIRLGYETDYVSDVASQTNLSKALDRIDKRLIAGTAKKFFSATVLPGVQNNKYDYIVMIHTMGSSLTGKMIEYVKNLQPQARMIMYQWDAERFLPLAKDVQPYFDAVFTFDRGDFQSNSRYQFLPLFYMPSYDNASIYSGSETLVYDCAYVGTAHPKKINEVNQMAAGLKETMPRQFIYHYMPSRLKFIYHKVHNEEYRHVHLKDLQMKKLSAEEISLIYRRSKCVLDAPQAGQSGLTMRTIESCLGMRKKLITTNADIRNYDFYRTENIYIYQGKIDVKDPFFTSPYVQLPETIYQKYSLRQWLLTLLSA